jgi:hypothetical protein
MNKSQRLFRRARLIKTQRKRQIRRHLEMVKLRLKIDVSLKFNICLYINGVGFRTIN